MLQIIKLRKKIHMIIVQDSGEPGYEVHNDITTIINRMTYNILVDTKVHPGF